MKRLVAAFQNSISSLKHGFANEKAIQQELILIFVSIPVALFITLDPWRLLALWGSLLLILIVELLNTGIEALSDEITLEHSDQIKIAKDAGSAAVLGSCLIALGVWGITLYEWIAS